MVVVATQTENPTVQCALESFRAIVELALTQEEQDEAEEAYYAALDPIDEWAGKREAALLRRFAQVHADQYDEEMLEHLDCTQRNVEIVNREAVSLAGHGLRESRWLRHIADKHVRDAEQEQASEAWYAQNSFGQLGHGSPPTELLALLRAIAATGS
jgi:hypothetical protein